MKKFQGEEDENEIGGCYNFHKNLGQRLQLAQTKAFEKVTVDSMYWDDPKVVKVMREAGLNKVRKQKSTNELDRSQEHSNPPSKQTKFADNPDSFINRTNKMFQDMLENGARGGSNMSLGYDS